MSAIDRHVLAALCDLDNAGTEHELCYQLRRRGVRVAGESLRCSLDRLVVGGHAERGMALGLPVWAAREAVAR